MDYRVLPSQPVTMLAHLRELDYPGRRSWHLHPNDNDVFGAGLVRRLHRRHDTFHASTMGTSSLFPLPPNHG